MPNSSIIKQGVGLVLSGGGGKGAYEIGVWKALDEYGITSNIHAISGTSVGALNAVLVAQGDLELALNVWSTISPQAVMTLNDLPAYQHFASTVSGVLTGTRFFDFAQSVHHWIAKRCADQGVLSKEGLSHLIDSAIDLHQVMSFMGPIYAAAFNISSQSLNYFDLKQHAAMSEIKERLLASASIPVVFGKTYIDGELYWDGGLPVVGDNTPVKPLYEDGFRSLIVVHLTRGVPVDRKAFPDCNIMEIMPQDDLGGMVSGTMNFKPESAKENIQRGYNDALRVLKPLFKTGSALSRIQHAFHEISQEQSLFTEQYHLLDQKTKHSGEEIDSLLKTLNKGGST